MGQDVSKTFSSSVVKLEIAPDNGGAPGAYVDVGLFYDEKITIKVTPTGPGRETQGAEIQGGYDSDLNMDSMQVLDGATLEATYKNVLCWVKGTMANGKVVTAPKYRLNIASDLQLSAKGKSVITISSKKYAATLADCYTIA